MGWIVFGIIALVVTLWGGDTPTRTARRCMNGREKIFMIALRIIMSTPMKTACHCRGGDWGCWF